jgi:predicted MFS family arabinose efflux permease
LTAPLPGGAPTFADRWALMSDGGFQRVWFSGLVTEAIRWLEMVATAIFVFQLTGRAFDVAIVMFCRQIPMVLFGALYGGLAERMDRRVILLSAMGLLTIGTAVLGLLALFDAIRVWHIAIGGFLGGTVFATDFPVRRVVLGEIAGLRRVGIAMSLDLVTRSSTRMLGPAAGGILLASTGLSGTYFLATALYAIAFYGLWSLRYEPEVQTRPVGNILRNILDGFRYIRTQRMVQATLLVTAINNMLIFPYITMVTPIAQGTMSLSESLTGILTAFEGAGAFIGALVIAATARQVHYARIYFYGSLLAAGAAMAFSFTGSFVTAAAMLLVAGMGVGCFAAMQSTLIVLKTEPAMRSRVMGVMSVAIGAGPLGTLQMGSLAEWIGPQGAILLLSATGAALLIGAAILWPELRRRVD